MAHDLDTLKKALWQQFEIAVQKQGNYEDRNSTGSSTPTNIAIAGRASIGALAQAIVAVESEQRIQAESIASKPSPLKKPASTP